jgi:hypothetical protein
MLALPGTSHVLVWGQDNLTAGSLASFSRADRLVFVVASSRHDRSVGLLLKLSSLSDCRDCVWWWCLCVYTVK